MKDSLLLQNQICFPLYAASRLVSQLYAQVFAKYDMTYPQYLVLLVLWEKKSQSVSEIGDLLYLDSGTLTPLIKRMEKRGWVERVRSKKDERRVDIKLTASGKKLQASFTKVPEQMACNFECSATELKNLRQQLNKLIGSMQNTLKGGLHE